MASAGVALILSGSATPNSLKTGPGLYESNSMRQTFTSTIPTARTDVCRLSSL